MKVYRGRLTARPGGPMWDDARVEVYVADVRDVGSDPATGRLALVGPLPHHSKHSPSGFSWGYAGSGPAELARCLLIDHLGDKAWCERCRGAGKLVWRFPRDGESTDSPSWIRSAIRAVEAVLQYDPGVDYGALTAAGDPHDVGPCDACWGERTSFPPATYQRLKFDKVTRWPIDGWELTSVEIDEWLAFDQIRLAANG